jgi:hypothetical protein
MEEETEVEYTEELAKEAG